MIAIADGCLSVIDVAMGRSKVCVERDRALQDRGCLQCNSAIAVTFLHRLTSTEFRRL